MLTQDGQCDYNPYVLEFEDNFEGNSLDLSKWQIQPWGQGALQGQANQEYMSLEIPNTTNAIDGHFADLKNKLRSHNGLSTERKKKFIDEFFKA